MGLDDFVEMTKNYAQGIVPAVNHNSTQESDGQVSKWAHTKETWFSYSEGCLNPSVFTLKINAELASSGNKKTQRRCWGFGRSNLMLDSEQTGAIKKAMDMKLMVIMIITEFVIFVSISS